MALLLLGLATASGGLHARQDSAVDSAAVQAAAVASTAVVPDAVQPGAVNINTADAPALAAGRTDRFMNAVAQRSSNPGPGKTESPARPSREKAPEAPPEPEPDDRTPLQKLVDKFR